MYALQQAFIEAARMSRDATQRNGTELNGSVPLHRRGVARPRMLRRATCGVLRRICDGFATRRSKLHELNMFGILRRSSVQFRCVAATCGLQLQLQTVARLFSQSQMPFKLVQFGSVPFSCVASQDPACRCDATQRNRSVPSRRATCGGHHNNSPATSTVGYDA